MTAQIYSVVQLTEQGFERMFEVTLMRHEFERSEPMTEREFLTDSGEWRHIRYAPLAHTMGFRAASPRQEREVKNFNLRRLHWRDAETMGLSADSVIHSWPLRDAE